MSLCVLAGAKVTTFAISFFTLVWTHSVEKVEWQEDWKIINSKLKIVESRVKGSGAGITCTNSQPSLPQVSKICLVACESSGTVAYSNFIKILV